MGRKTKEQTALLSAKSVLQIVAGFKNVLICAGPECKGPEGKPRNVNVQSCMELDGSFAKAAMDEALLIILPRPDDD